MVEDPIAFLTSNNFKEPAARPHLWPLIIIVLVLMAVAVGFFGSGNITATTPIVSGSPSQQARVYSVNYRFGVFSPTNLRIHVGDTVRFRNDSALPIRIIAQIQPGQRNPEFDSVGDVQPGGYFSYTFATKGIFGYNNYDNENESGVIMVR